MKVEFTNLMPDDETPGPEVEPEKAVWEQQEGESALHFSWFYTFLSMGEGRSVLGAYNAFQAKKGKERQSQQASGAWNKTAEQWRWRQRAIAYDAHQRVAAEHRKMHARLQEEKELEDRAFSIRKRLYDKVEQMLNVPIVTVETTSEDGKSVTVNPAKWNYNTITRLIHASEMLKSEDGETTVTIKGKDVESGAVAFKTRRGVKEYSDEELLAIVMSNENKKDNDESSDDGDSST